MNNQLKIAFAELGTSEQKGKNHNPRILAYANDIGMTWVNDDETPWCSIFVNWVCKQAKLPMSNAANARSWVAVGETIKNPFPGDVVVFWRGSINSWEGHVGFFLGFSDDLSKVYCLGGNQGNSVSIEAFSADKVLRFQRLSVQTVSQIPRPVLKLGSKGAEVFKLQKFLNAKGYDCGDPDSDFGPKTERALKVFQADNGLVVDGVCNAKNTARMESILMA